MSTARNDEVAIGLFVEYLRDAHYGWARVCLERFGEVPQPVFHEGNSCCTRSSTRAIRAGARWHYDEVQALFDRRATPARQDPGSGPQRRVGVLCGTLRCSRSGMPTARAGQSRHGLIWSTCEETERRRSSVATAALWSGSASRQKGSPPKRRTVLTVPEMDWVVEVLDQWVSEVRPQFTPGGIRRCG